MPAMPRMNNKVKKIAYKILGVPSNMKDDRKIEKPKIEARLEFEDIVRVR